MSFGARIQYEVVSPIVDSLDGSKIEDRNAQGPDVIHDEAALRAQSIDAVLESIPLGFYHYRLLVICGLNFMADGMEVALLSFISLCAGAEWGLSDTEISLIVSILYLGLIVGTAFWGPFADRYGRRKAFMGAGLIMTLAGFLSAFCPDIISLIIVRAFVGFGVGGISVSFDLLAEFMPTRKRGKQLMYIEYFWALGSMFVSAAAWIILPAAGGGTSTNSGGQQPQWRLLTLVTAIPVGISVLVSVPYLPESPRWLLEEQRVKEAEVVVQEIATTNQYNALGAFQLKPLPARSTGAAADTSSTSTSECTMSAIVARSPFCQLLTKKRLGLTIAVWLVWFSFGVAYYGVVLFITRLYQESGTKYSYSSVGAGDGGDDDFDAALEQAVDNDQSGLCIFDYTQIFLSSASEVIGVTVASLLIDWSRRKTQMVLYTLGAGCVLILGAQQPVHTLHQKMVFSMMSILARVAAMGSASATWVALPEMYQTDLRATAHSFANAASHVGALVAPFVVESSSISMTHIALFLAAFNLLAVLGVYLTPETAGNPIDQQSVATAGDCSDGHTNDGCDEH